jgi:hypothetical protein
VIGAGGLNNADSGKNEGLKKIIDSTSRKLFITISPVVIFMHLQPNLVAYQL